MAGAVLIVEYAGEGIEGEHEYGRLAGQLDDFYPGAQEFLGAVQLSLLVGPFAEHVQGPAGAAPVAESAQGGQALLHQFGRTGVIACYQHALELRMVLGDRYYQAHTLARLGDAHHPAGDLDAASAAWRRALHAFDELDPPNAGALRDKLARLISG